MPQACETGQSPSQGRDGGGWWGGGDGHMTSGWEVGLSLSQCGHVFVSSLRVTTELIGHLDRGS